LSFLKKNYNKKINSTEKNLIRRQKFLIILTSSALFLAIIGLVVSLMVKSPQQQILDSQAQYTQITAPVDQKILQKKLIARATVNPAGSQNIYTFLQASPSIVTGVFVSNGDEVHNGELLAEISGRPIMLFQGQTPAYRTIMPEDNGKDVAELQTDLINLGYSNSQSGTYDDSTQRAISGYYASLGYSLPDNNGKAYIPMGELTFASTLPSSVQKLSLGGVGDVAKTSSSIMELNSGGFLAKASITQDQKEGLQPGMPVILNDDINNRKTSGKITSIDLVKNQDTDGQTGSTDMSGLAGLDSSVTGTDDSNSNGGYTITVKPNKSLDSSWNNIDVALEISIASTGGAVLCVPQTAVKVNTDSQNYITIKKSDGSTKDVTVQTGLIGDGFIEIKNTTDINKGDLVVVG
jgi:multidrug efflux pump subunit AcrA (membrane-fusion protein)